MKNIRNKFILVFTMALIAIGVKAQQVPLYNQYFNAGTLAYPSGAVFQEHRYISLVYRDQFGGLVGAPKNFALAYNSTFRNKLAFTGNVTTADIGFTSQVKFSGGIGYKLFGEANDGLSIGSQVGLSFFSLNEERVNPENPSDNVLVDLLGNNGSSLSVDFSASYRKGRLGIDVAVPTVINQSLSDDAYIRINDDNVPDFIGGARYGFTINPELSFTPYLGVRLRETIGAELDVMGELDFKDKFKASLGYRDNYGPTIGIGAQLLPKLLFTYNYDFGQKDAPFLADGFNEFGLHYQLNTPEEKANVCEEEGLAVVNRIIDQRIFDENLVNPEDKEKALCYLKSLEEGKKKEVNKKAEEAYKALFLKIEKEELAKIEAARLEALRVEKAKQEAEEAAAERRRVEEIERAKMKELERLALEKERAIKKALSLATESVAFNSGSANLKEESFESLNQVVELLKSNPELRLKLSGYTDNSGNAQSNLALSKQRAAAVKAYLVSQDVAADRLEAEGYGIANPRADNSTAEGRALNRRVELSIIKK
ncbi:MULTISPECIES: PorP/SprF family type IX secretion system membrane protein [Roseivirga]|nr:MULTISPECIES: PorP/SprF family type IX secretion system membrane protein [Roseivirga]MBO6659728.1 PorP/SprF family type IX secretion system membrane protein [Roseivirga sp.]MBO6760091.1 PorP/SprF family type IX secretion system membrane protein [Roseivirga sp.]MBO6907535.1 PorP/SprF family type IX secretion system membrane protein [Roseivirga sp.]WPZ09909.1 PorP/SprF family type IX secretion system membrane protein [Roseivirga spongicola]